MAHPSPLPHSRSQPVEALALFAEFLTSGPGVAQHLASEQGDVVMLLSEKVEVVQLRLRPDPVSEACRGALI